MSRLSIAAISLSRELVRGGPALKAAPESKLREQLTTMCLAYLETVTAMVA